MTKERLTTWSDDPIDSIADDELDRAVFARQAAYLIDKNHSPNKSVVYGLVGPWGSGKSSLINMVQENLAQGDQSWTVSHFTPWSAADADSVVADFFRTISHSLPRKSDSRESVRKYARLATPILNAIPIAGGAVAGTADRAIDTFLAAKPWQEQFTALSSELAKLKLFVLVVVDDLDRLHQNELLNVFRSIRLLGRFPGVDYLLAYDQDSVRSTLQGSDIVSDDEERALRYMEKIVQYPLLIPPVQPMHLDRIFQRGIRSIFSEIDNWSPGDSQRLEECYNQMLRYRLSTVRAMHRFLGQLRQYLPLIEETEINSVDYILLTFLRVHYPRLYSALPILKHRLFGEGFFSPWDKPSQKERASVVTTWLTETLVQLVARNDAEALGLLLRNLFVGLDVNGYNTLDGRRRGISDPDYFDRYFNFGIPIGDISDQYVANAVSGTAAGDATATALLRELILAEDFGMSSRALDKAILASRELRSGGSDSLLKFALEIYTAISPRTEFMSNPRFRVREWISQLALWSTSSASSLVSDFEQAMGVFEMIKAVIRAQSVNDGRSAMIDELQIEAGGRAIECLIDQLKSSNRDSAGQMANLYWAARKLGDADDPRERLWAVVDDGAVSLDDIAAIWVVTSPEFPGEAARITGYDATPLGDLMAYRGLTRDERLGTRDGDEFDDTDLSWVNRMRYAAGFVRMWGRKVKLDSFAHPLDDAAVQSSARNPRHPTDQTIESVKRTQGLGFPASSQHPGVPRRR